LAEAPSPGSDVAPAEPRPINMGAIFRTPQFFILAGVFFLCCAAHSGPIFHTVSYAMLCGVSALGAATIYSVEGFAGLFGRVIFGVLADRIGVKRVIVVGLAMQAIGIYCYIYVSDLQHFYMLAVVLGLVYGGVMPLYSVLARDYFGPNVMGTVLGGITMTSSIGMAFGPVGGGWLFDTFGDYHWLYVTSAAVGIAAAALALAFPPKTTKETPADALPA
jgi:MFS family permease